MEASRWPEPRSIGREALLGAFAAAAAVVLVMPAFFPLGRLFDPSIGGDPRGSLTAEIALGGFGGVALSPVAALLGAFIGTRLRSQSIRPATVAKLIALGVGIAVSIFVALNGGLIDESDSLASLAFVSVLGALAGSTATAIFIGTRRLLSVQ